MKIKLKTRTFLSFFKDIKGEEVIMKQEKILPCVIDYFSDIEVMNQTYHKISSLQNRFWYRISDEKLSNKFLDRMDSSQFNELMIDSMDAKFNHLLSSKNYKRKSNMVQSYDSNLEEFHETYIFSQTNITFKQWFLERYESNE